MIRPRQLLVLIAAAGCASAPGPVPPPPAALAAPPPAPAAAAPAPVPAPRPAIGLELVVVPADAEVDIEGVRRGPASVFASETGGVVPLEPGVYRVSVRRPGYATWRAEVSVRAAVERIEVTLTENR